MKEIDHYLEQILVLFGTVFGQQVTFKWLLILLWGVLLRTQQSVVASYINPSGLDKEYYHQSLHSALQIINLDSKTPKINSAPINSKVIKVGFENHAPGTTYNKTAQSKDWDVVGTSKTWMSRSVITDSEAYSGDRSLKITYLPDQVQTSGGFAKWALPSEQEYYLSYRVKFADDFDFGGPIKSGGKLPGLAARDRENALCGGGKTCTGDNGFTARNSWGRDGKARLYLYHMDKPGKYGESFFFEGEDGSQKYYERGKWHNLIQRVKINDGNRSNGEVDVWMDGEQVLSVDGLRFVTNNQGIDTLVFQTFHGGSTNEFLPEKEVYSYWDDFVISTNAADVGL